MVPSTLDKKIDSRQGVPNDKFTAALLFLSALMFAVFRNTRPSTSN